MDTPSRVSGKYECSSCRRVFTYRKCLAKHILACKGEAVVPVQIEAQDDTLKDAVHCTAVIKQEFRAPIDEAKWTYQAPERETLQTTSPTVRATVVNTENQITVDNLSVKATGYSEACTNGAKDSTKSEKPIDPLSDDINDDPRDLLQISTRMDTENKEELLKYRTRAQYPRKSTSNEGKYKCDNCGVSFVTDIALREHRLHHLRLKPYKCYKCKMDFECRADLKEHLKSHKGEMSLATPVDLKKHKRRHVGIKSYNCAICERSFHRAHLLQAHARTHVSTKNRPLERRPSGLHKCKGCGQSFLRVAHLRRHKQKCKIFLDGKAHTSKRRAAKIPTELHTYKCFLCTASFPSSRHFNTHGWLRHMDHDACRCLTCGIKTFRNPTGVTSHIKGCFRKRKNKVYGCNHCESAFKKPGGLEEHLETHILFKCTECGESVATFTDLRDHMEQHHNDSMQAWYPDVVLKEEKEEVPVLNPYPEEITNSPSATASEEQLMNLPYREENILLASNQLPTADMPARTDAVDGKSQSTDSSMPQTDVAIKMEYHNDSIGEDVTYADESPELSETAEPSLLHHYLELDFQEAESPERSAPGVFQPQQVSTPIDTNSKEIHVRRGSKVHECHICQKQFTSGSALKCHVQRHMGILPHKCKMCDLSFISPSALKLHENRHLGIRPYKCPTCDHASVTRTELKKHMQSHVRRLKFKHKCTFCGSFFTKLDELQQHLDLHEEINADRMPVENSQAAAVKHKCDMCEKSFETESALMNHKRLHPTVYKCNVCDAAFSIRVRFDDHMNSHLGVKAHKCHICRKAFVYRSYLKVHIKKHMGKLQHECTMCERSFVTPFSLREHMNRHLGIKPHQCSICQLAYVTNYELKSHMKSHRDQAYEDGSEQFFEILEHDAEYDLGAAAAPANDDTAIEASAVNVEQFNLEELPSNPAINGIDVNSSLLSQSAVKSIVLHGQATDFELQNINPQLTSDLLEKSDSLVFPSSQPAEITVRNEGTPSPSSPTNHTNISVKVEDQSDDDVVITDVYEAPPMINLGLKRSKGGKANQLNGSTDVRHPRASSSNAQKESESYNCDECDIQFGTSDELITHLKEHLANMAHECHFCGKTFGRDSALKRHIKIHTQNLRFKCAQCERSFSDSSSLRAHQNRHLGVKPFKCTSHGCAQAFVTRSELNRHLKMHLRGPPRSGPVVKIKTQDCHLCEKSFQSATSLKRHLEEHKGDLPFKCTLCEKSFLFASHLKLHQNRHMGLKPYTCNTCGQHFATRSDLNRHLRKHLRTDFGGDEEGNTNSKTEDNASEYSIAEVDPLDNASLQDLDSQGGSQAFSIVFMEDQEGVLNEIEQIDLSDDDSDELNATPGNNGN